MSSLQILVVLPTWLGDCVMCTPALDRLRQRAPGARVVGACRPGPAQLFQQDSRFDALVLDKTKQQGRRWRTIPQLARQIRAEHGPFDLAFAFKNSFSSRWLMFGTGTPRRIGAKSGWTDLLLTDAIPCGTAQHYVPRYHQLVADFFGSQDEAGPLRLHVAAPVHFVRPTVGLAPGSAYGPARRWAPARFGQLAVALSRDFDVLILGGPQEQPQADTIEAALRLAGVRSYRNLIGQSVSDMVNTMAGLALYIGHDSGATHIATALRIPTLVLYGSTSPDLAYPWRHPASRIIRHPLPCAPCNRRTCPLQHHACMQQILVEHVLDAAHSLTASHRLAAAS